MIPDSEIPKCPEFEDKLKIRKRFKNHNPPEEYSVKIYKIDPYFYKYYEKKYKLINYQQQKLMKKKKKILTDLIFEKKRKKHEKTQKKKARVTQKHLLISSKIKK